MQQRLVGLHSRQLLGLYDDGDPSLISIASPEDVAAYDPAEGECCNENNFQVDFWGMASSPWNQSCARVFARSFLTHYPHYEAVLPHGQRSVEITWVVDFVALRNTYL